MNLCSFREPSGQAGQAFFDDGSCMTLSVQRKWRPTTFHHGHEVAGPPPSFRPESADNPHQTHASSNALEMLICGCLSWLFRRGGLRFQGVILWLVPTFTGEFSGERLRSWRANELKRQADVWKCGSVRIGCGPAAILRTLGGR